MINRSTTKNPFNIIVIVAALGYFVDIYDLILFGIVMKPSLKSIGIPDEQMFDVGGNLLGMQMIGMLVGGIVWGILGDKKGRLSTLFLTIILYSLANPEILVAYDALRKALKEQLETDGKLLEKF